MKTTFLQQSLTKVFKANQMHVGYYIFSRPWIHISAVVFELIIETVYSHPIEGIIINAYSSISDYTQFFILIHKA